MIVKIYEDEDIYINLDNVKYIEFKNNQECISFNRCETNNIIIIDDRRYVFHTENENIIEDYKKIKNKIMSYLERND